MTCTQPSGAHAPPTEPRPRPRRLFSLALLLALTLTACAGSGDGDTTPDTTIPTQTAVIVEIPLTATTTPPVTASATPTVLWNPTPFPPTPIPTITPSPTATIPASAVLSPPFTRPEDLLAYAVQRAREGDWQAIEAVTVPTYGVAGWGQPGESGGRLPLFVPRGYAFGFEPTDWVAEWQDDLAILTDTTYGVFRNVARRMDDGTLLLDPGSCAVMQARWREHRAASRQSQTPTPISTDLSDAPWIETLDVRGATHSEVDHAVDARLECEQVGERQTVTMYIRFYEDGLQGEVDLTQAVWSGPDGTSTATATAIGVTPIWLDTTLDAGRLVIGEGPLIPFLSLQPPPDAASDFSALTFTLHLTLPDGRTAEVDYRANLNGETYPTVPPS